MTDAKGAAEATIESLVTIVLPDMAAAFAPMVYALPVQLLAYHTAVIMGTDVGQPRNLAKSVPVETGLSGCPLHKPARMAELGTCRRPVRPVWNRMNREDLPPTITTGELPADHPRGLMARFRNYFLTGLIVAGPIAITLYLTWWFVTWVDGLVRPFV